MHVMMQLPLHAYIAVVLLYMEISWQYKQDQSTSLQSPKMSIKFRFLNNG